MMQPTSHRSLPAELRIMPLNFRLMELIGVQGPRRNIYRFLLAFAWGVSVIHFPKAILGMGSAEIDVIVKGSAELQFQTVLYSVTAILVVHMRTFRRAIQVLSEIIRDVTAEDQPRDFYDFVREETRKINKLTNIYCFYCCIGPIVFLVPAMATSCWRYYGAVGNGTEPVQFELPMEQEFYGLQIRTNFAHYNFFMACSLVAYYVSSYFLVIKGIALLMLIKYNAVTYQLVTMRIQKLPKCPTFGCDPNVIKSKVKAVVEIVKLHNKALEITELVEKIINIPLGMLFVACAMFWCLVMVYVSTGSVITFSTINMMVLFVVTFIETYGASHLGSELTESARAVGEAIYELNWYNDSVQLQHYYRTILRRAQRATGITAAKFFLVGKDKFMNVVNMSYSYYLVLKDVLNTL